MVVGIRGENLSAKALKAKVSLEAPKRKRDREGSVRALLEAAIEVFSQRGYDAATTREVAKKAGVSEALIQRYFDGKNGLLVAIMESFASEQAETVLAMLPYQPSLEKEILQMLNEACCMYKDRAQFIRVSLSRAIVDPKIANVLRVHVHERRLPAMVARLLHYQQTGLIKKEVDLKALAFGISSMAFSLGFMGREVFDLDPAQLEQITLRFAKILCHGAV